MAGMSGPGLPAARASGPPGRRRTNRI